MIKHLKIILYQLINWIKFKIYNAMGIRAKNVHFSDWAKVREGLIKSNAIGITASSTDEEVRAFLKNTSSNDNPFYYYIVYIKSTKEIYTHGQFYPGNFYITDFYVDDLINIAGDGTKSIPVGRVFSAVRDRKIIYVPYGLDGGYYGGFIANATSTEDWYTLTIYTRDSIITASVDKGDDLYNFCGNYVSVKPLLFNSSLKTINGQSIVGTGNLTISADLDLIDGTYNELRNLKNKGKLIPGRKYRMTDYVTFAGGEVSGCMIGSLEYPFDLILTAITPYEFDSRVTAKICPDNGSDRGAFSNWYYRGANLENWEIYYRFDGYDSYGPAWATFEHHYNCVGLPFPVLFTGYIDNGDSYMSDSRGSEAVLSIDIDGRYIIVGSLLYPDGSEDSMRTFSFWPEMTELYENDGCQAWKNDSGDFVITPILTDHMEENIKVLKRWDVDASYKGVIYKMIDPYGNEAPYDFTNIRFYSEWKYTGMECWFPTFAYFTEFGGKFQDATIVGRPLFTDNKVSVPSGSSWESIALRPICIVGDYNCTGCRVSGDIPTIWNQEYCDTGTHIFVTFDQTVKKWKPYELVQ